ncbi:MAG: hypothetical protein SGJ17_00440 [Hyphomicrobiales bacterium]|nr:hypothetical protein [Hyphomicrobiales bacterium]
MSAEIIGLDAFKRRLATASAMPSLSSAAREAGSVLQLETERRLSEVALDEAAGVGGQIAIISAADGSVRLEASGHAAAVEFGTLARPARPWLEPALAASREGIAAAFARWLKSTIKGERL